MKQCCLFVFFLLALLSSSFLALAQTIYTVSSTADSGPNTLRQAILDGNVTGAYQINISTAGPISLTAALPSITKSCTIIGASPVNALAETGGSVIKRNSGAGTDFSLLRALTGGTTLYLQDLVLEDGRSPNGGNFRGGGGVLTDNGARLTMLRCVIRTNTTVNNGGGGGGVQVANGPALITNCLFLSNSTTGNGFGGGLKTGYDIFSNPQSVTVVSSAFVNNSGFQGGGLNNLGTTLLFNCSFLGNTAPFGGAIHNRSGTVTLSNCALWNNGGANAIQTVTGNGATTTASYCLIESGATDYTGGNNQIITASPFSGPSVGLAAGSLAIDAGDPATSPIQTGNTDLAGNPRFKGCRIDAGAVEFQANTGQLLAITQQPPSGSLVCPGSTVSIPLSASGTGPITYQLYQNGTAVGSAQSSTPLTLMNVQPNQAGSYSVVVTGFCNSVTSTAFSLTVNTPVSLSNDGPLTCTKTTATLTATPGGQGTYVFSAPAMSQGANTATVSQTGVYSVTLTSAGGCTRTAQTTVTATQTPPTPSVFTTNTPDGLAVQVSGGVSYERVRVIDRINGYEIRQTEQNQTGYFLITQRGPYSITVIGANGCRAVVTGTF